MGTFMLETFNTEHGSHECPQIHQYLRQYGYKRWGFVIYHCVYDDDESWDTFLKTFKALASDSLHQDGDEGLQLLEQLEWTIIEDRERLDGASKAMVRKAFQEWVDNCDETEPEGKLSWDAGRGAKSDPRNSGNPRYSYSIMVDAAVLESMTPHKEETVDGNEFDVLEAFVILVKMRWPDRDFLPPEVKEESDRDYAEAIALHGEDVFDEGEPEIDGCSNYDVGFMHVDMDGVYPTV